MSTPGPWSQLPPPNPPPRPPARATSRVQGWAFFALIAALVLGVVGLSRLFPGRLNSPEDWTGVASLIAMATMIGARLLSRQQSGGKMLQYLAVWAGVAAVLLLGYSFRDDFGAVAARLRSAVVPGYAVPTAPGEQMISRDQDGAFYIVADLNGMAVRFAVDTGASDVVLSPADAQRLGVDLAALKFDHPYETANGVGYGAPYVAASLKVGPVALTDVPMSINQAKMSSSLLGMAFFNRLKSFRFEGDRLYLKAKA